MRFRVRFDSTKSTFVKTTLTKRWYLEIAKKFRNQQKARAFFKPSSTLYPRRFRIFSLGDGFNFCSSLFKSLFKKFFLNFIYLTYEFQIFMINKVLSQIKQVLKLSASNNQSLKYIYNFPEIYQSLRQLKKKIIFKSSI